MLGLNVMHPILHDALADEMNVAALKRLSINQAIYIADPPLPCTDTPVQIHIATDLRLLIGRPLQRCGS